MVTIKMMVNLLLCQLYKHRPGCCSLQPGPLITRSVGCLGVRDYNDGDDTDHDCDDCDKYIDGDCDNFVGTHQEYMSVHSAEWFGLNMDDV